MQTKLPKTGFIRLLLPLAALVVGGAALAQLTEEPPVKMGLWQSEVTSTMTGLEGTPMAAMSKGPRTMVTQSCLTPDHWKKDIEGVNQRRGCTMTNLHQDSHEVSFDEACDAGGGTSNTHVDMLIDSSEHVHGTVTMKMNNPRLPNGITTNMSMVTHFVSSDCGNVKPGEGKIIH
jgi:hypothetical protein